MRTRRFNFHEFKENPELQRLLKESIELVKRMTSDEHKKMIDAQRESWARQDMD